MTTEDVFRSINIEINIFEYRHGEKPEKIFVSYPLFDLLALHRSRYIEFIADDTMNIQLFGIPVQLYKCEECEFYLAERKGKFRKGYNGAELYFKEGEENDGSKTTANA